MLQANLVRTWPYKSVITWVIMDFSEDAESAKLQALLETQYGAECEEGTICCSARSARGASGSRRWR